MRSANRSVRPDNLQEHAYGAAIEFGGLFGCGFIRVDMEVGVHWSQVVRRIFIAQVNDLQLSVLLVLVHGPHRLLVGAFIPPLELIATQVAAGYPLAAISPLVKKTVQTLTHFCSTIV